MRWPWARKSDALTSPVRFSWDLKEADYEILWLRLNFTPDIALTWKTRVQVDKFGAKVLSHYAWPTFWVASDGAAVAHLSRYDVYPAYDVPSPSMDGVEELLTILCDMDILTAAIKANELAAILAQTEKLIAQPHRRAMQPHEVNKHWVRTYARPMEDLRKSYSEWLDSLPPVMAGAISLAYS